MDCTQLKIEGVGLAPHIVMNFATMTVICVYNEFTAEAYSANRRRQSKKEMSLKFQNTMRTIEATPTTSRKKLLLGDINLSWTTNEEGIRN